MQHVALSIGTVAQMVLGRGAGGAIVQADGANTADIYLGAQNVTANTAATGGYRLAAGSGLPLVIEGNDPLWAVVASGTQLLRVLAMSDDATIGAP